LSNQENFDKNVLDVFVKVANEKYTRHKYDGQEKLRSLVAKEVAKRREEKRRKETSKRER